MPTLCTVSLSTPDLVDLSFEQFSGGINRRHIEFLAAEQKMARYCHIVCSTSGIYHGLLNIRIVLEKDTMCVHECAVL